MTTTTTARNCPPPGCPLFPLDVISSEPTRSALETLRKQGKNASDYPQIMESLQSAGDEDKVALTLMGYKGGSLAEQINQDAATILSPFTIMGINGGENYYNGDYGSSSTTAIQLLAVCDGHGKMGEITSAYAAKEIPRVLAAKLSQLVLEQQVTSPTELKQSLVKKAIQESFIEVDKSDPTGGVGGATATMVLQLGHKLYVANAGDSRSFVGVHVDGSVRVVYASREDKPDLPDERQRIMEMGGYVHIPADTAMDVPRAYHVDAQGRARFGLAMSRTIGDWLVQGVIAEPIVDVINVAALVRDAITNHTEACLQHRANNIRRNSMYGYDPNNGRVQDCPPLDPSQVHILAASASDGMMDYLKPDEIAREFAASFFGKDDANGHQNHSFVVAEHLILKAAEGWDTDYRSTYRDDIVVSAFKVILNEQILEDGRRDLEEDHDEL